MVSASVTDGCVIWFLYICIVILLMHQHFRLQFPKPKVTVCATFWSFQANNCHNPDNIEKEFKVTCIESLDCNQSLALCIIGINITLFSNYSISLDISFHGKEMQISLFLLFPLPLRYNDTFFHRLVQMSLFERNPLPTRKLQVSKIILENLFILKRTGVGFF